MNRRTWFSSVSAFCAALLGRKMASPELNASNWEYLQPLLPTDDLSSGETDFTVTAWIGPVLVFNHLLTAQEREALYNSGQGLTYPFTVPPETN
jgi:hypothetical protein